MSIYAIGDIQGCADAFERLLDRLNFDPARDRLWLVGDLVNRGPASAAVLRRVMSLGKRVISVLGNHDLHLLAAATGIRETREADTFGDVLEAPDAGDMIDWLRHRPLLHWDERRATVLVHAGIPPFWDVREAKARAEEVETLLRGPGWHSVLRSMYGDAPLAWSPRLGREPRLRYTINALTRMRFCDRDGGLDLAHTGPPGSQPAGLVPWFDAAERANADVHIIFGHWSTLGFRRRRDFTALDSGCVWGRALTAVAVDAADTVVSVKCGAGGPT